MMFQGHLESLNATCSRIKMWEPETRLRCRCSIPTGLTVRVTRRRHHLGTTLHLTVFRMVRLTLGLNSRGIQRPNQEDHQQEASLEQRLLRWFQNRSSSRRKTRPTKSQLFQTWLAEASKWEAPKRKIIQINQNHLLRLRRKEVSIN